MTSFIGKQPTTGDFKKLDAITTSATTTFNLRHGGVAIYPQSAMHCIVSLNAIIQSPIDAFNIVNDTIVFASALTSNDVINHIIVLGNVNDIGTPSDDTVSQSKIQSEAVNESKMQISNAGSNNQFLQKQSGNTGGLTWATPSGFDVTSITGATALTTQPDGSNDEIVISDNGTLKRLDIKHIQNTPAFHATKASQSINNSSSTKVTWNSEVFDSDGTFDLATNERWTPAIAGKYFVYCSLVMDGIADGKSVYCQIKKNGSTLITNQAHSGQASSLSSLTCGIISLGDSDYVEAFVLHNHGSAINCVGGTNPSSHFGGFRIAGVS